MTLYIENPEEFIHIKILVLINEFSKLARFLEMLGMRAKHLPY